MTMYTIPTILIATVLVAGIFAFMPVDQASSVHTTILAGNAGYQCVTELFTVPATWDGDTLTFTFSNEGAPILITSINTAITTGFNAAEDWGVTSATTNGAIIGLVLDDANADAMEDVERDLLSASTGTAFPIFVESTLALLIDDNAGGGALDDTDVITFEICGLVSDPANFGGEDVLASNVAA